MVSKINGSDASFRRRMWQRIADKEKMDKLTEEEKKKIFKELLQLQHECELTCLGFDSWETGRDDLRVRLLSEQSKVGDLLYMKYKI